MKPIIKYRGGKAKEIQEFIRFIPNQYNTYFEPFLGGGALYFYIEPIHAVVNDINESLISFYRDIRLNFDLFAQQSEILERAYAENRALFEELKLSHPEERVEDRNEALYYRIRDMFNEIIPSEYTYSLLYYFINKTSYSGMIRYNSEGRYNVPFGRYHSFSGRQVTEDHIELLNRTEILNTDYENVFNLANENDFMFLDPPYQCVFSDYGNNGDFTEEDQTRLAENFYNLNCRCLMVIGASPLIRELYAGNIVGEYGKNYSVNIKNRFHSESTHLIVANYNLD